MALATMGNPEAASLARDKKKLRRALNGLLRYSKEYVDEMRSDGSVQATQEAYARLVMAQDHARKILKET